MGNKYKFEKLIEYKRNNLIEQEHYGLIVHINSEKVLDKIGNDKNYKFYHRSCMKPFQASLGIDYGLDKKYNLTIPELGVCSASHTGDLIHQELVLSVLSKLGFKESDLLCPAIQPLSKKEQNRLIINNLPNTKIHNNCSGKHSILLGVCKEKGFSVTNYTDYSHPLTELVINKVCELCETDKKEIILSKDGCSLPVIATSLENLCKGFLNLFLNDKYKKLKNAFLNYPYIIGGDGRLDSEIINASKGRIIAKVGAGGLCVMVNTDKKEALCVKIADANMEARAITAVEALLQLKWLNEKDVSSSHLNILYKKAIESETGELLGEKSVCFSLK